METATKTQIKPSDLRVGNWVLILTDQMVRVTEISGFKDRICVESERNLVVDLPNVEPIPLTPEILEMCGFEKRFDTTRFGRTIEETRRAKNALEEPFEYFVGWAKDSIVVSDHFNCRGAKLKYLHQLQNLFHALTGEELQYKP